MKNAGGSDCAMVVSFLEIYCDQIRDLGKAYLNQVNGVDVNSDFNNKTSELFERLQLERQSSFSRPRTVSRTESADSGDMPRTFSNQSIVNNQQDQ